MAGSMSHGSEAESAIGASGPCSDDVTGAEMRTTLAVIAGGAGRRMGGAKDALRINGAPILRSFLERICWKGPTMLVVRAEGASVQGHEMVNRVVADRVSGEGPLRGVLTALDGCETEALIAVPIDMPGLSAAHLAWLLERGVEGQSERLLLRRAVHGCAEIEPFPSFFRATGIEAIRGLLAEGKRALRDLAELPGTSVVEAPMWWGEEAWSNLNTPDDAARFGAQWRDTRTAGDAVGRS
jgi:molybdopterin-guanine dinucleotide biosynthesis protein A